MSTVFVLGRMPKNQDSAPLLLSANGLNYGHQGAFMFATQDQAETFANRSYPGVDFDVMTLHQEIRLGEHVGRVFGGVPA